MSSRQRSPRKPLGPCRDEGQETRSRHALPDTWKRTGPTPVGQRLRAQTTPARKRAGPTADEWA